MGGPIWRKHGAKWAMTHYHPYHTELSKRKGHFAFSKQTHMEVDSGESKAKRAKNSEAQMIPGLGPLEWGVPNSIITQLRYCDDFKMTSTLGATVSNVYRANGIFDPDYTGTGHQPLFRDAFVGLYDYYTVLGSKITVTYLSLSATVPFIVGLQGSDTPSLSSTVTTWCEQNNGVSALIGNISAGTHTLVMTYSPEENLGANMKDDQSSLVGTGSDPGSQQAYYFGILAGAANANTADIYVKVQIEYTVKFATITRRSQD